MYKPPIVTFLNDSEMELVEPFVYEWEDGGVEYQLTIPKGFTFNGACVPRFCWSLTGLLPTGVVLGPAAGHDYTYQRRGRLIRDELKQKSGGVWVPVADIWTRKECDDLF